MDWKEAYTPPFKYEVAFILDSKNRIVMNPLLSGSDTKKVIKKLNGEIDKKLPEGTFFSVKEDEPVYILYTDKTHSKVPTLLVRGWGRLHGIGGLNLPIEEAVKVQNDFIQWIVKTLNS